MPATYRDAPLVKPPVWTWEVPLYFFVGGVAGVAAVIGAAATFAAGDTGTLGRDAKCIAAIGAVISPLLLISDLGRPARFLNMLRVFKLRSPMSVGAWMREMFEEEIGALLEEATTIGELVACDPNRLARTLLTALTGARG